jgi:hypothetical protein
MLPLTMLYDADFGQRGFPQWRIAPQIRYDYSVAPMMSTSHAEEAGATIRTKGCE